MEGVARMGCSGRRAPNVDERRSRSKNVMLGEADAMHDLVQLGRCWVLDARMGSTTRAGRTDRGSSEQCLCAL
jgi:hypothetical protein